MSAKFVTTSPRVLLVVASPIEARAILNGSELSPWTPHAVFPGLDVLMTGIGKANAAGAVGRCLDATKYDLVVNAGIAGTLAALPIRSTVVATFSIFADEGIQTPTSFLDCSAMGFPLGDFEGSAVPASPAALAWLRGFLEHATFAPIATVSTCSGTDTLAAAIRGRTGAVAEAMEGAAIALVCKRLAVSFVELRIISNTTGDRARQQWDIKGALAELASVIGTLAQALREAPSARKT